MFDCLFIGSSTQDLMMLVDAPPYSDRRISASRKLTTCGGPGSTAAAAFAVLGGRASLITAVGDDDTGVFIRNDLKSRNFTHLQLIEIPNAASSFSTIQVERNGKRCITCYGGCTDLMTLSMLRKEEIAQAPMIHLAGLNELFLIEAVRFCRQLAPKAILSVDGGNYSLETAKAILPYTDIYIPDDKTVANTLGVPPKDACKYYYELGAKIVCITLGEKGSLAFDGRQFVFAHNANVQVVDTTGAGDNFHGAFLYCVYQRFDLPKTLRFCNAFSGLTCEGLGGREALPTRECVLKKMEEISVR